MQKRFMQQVQTQLWLTVSQPIGLWSTSLMLTGATIALPVSMAQASSLQWQYDPESAALSVKLPAGSTPRYFLAAQPARIVVDLPNTDVGTVQTEKQFPGAVQQIRIAQFQPGITRIVMQLAPGTVLAPQQVNLEQSGDRWILRPVLADASPASTPTPPIAAQSPEGAIAALNSPAPQAAGASPANAAPATPAAPAVPAAVNPAPASSAPENLAAVNPATPALPPLEPGATEIPVELPPAEPATIASPTVSVPDLSAVAANPAPVSPATESSSPSENPTPAPQTPAPQTPAPQTPDIQTSENQAPENPAPAAQTPAAQTPAAQAPEAQPPTVQPSTPQTPDIQATEPSSRQSRNSDEATTAAIPEELPPAEPDALPAELPPATITPSTEHTVNVPALESPRPSPARTRDVEAIEFGQPLPGAASANASSRATSRETAGEGAGEAAVAVNSAPGVLLPAGTVLSLRYQGEETLNLTSDYPLQEVLVVDRDVQDQSGQVIVPAGSQVIGRFETGSAGSEFIAQAINIDGQNFLLNGRSNKLSGDREVSSNRMMRNSALGAVAGTLLGAVTGFGLVAGIAAGAASSAATTYLTAPQPAVIEPDRVVEVRLLEDLRQSGLAIGG